MVGSKILTLNCVSGCGAAMLSNIKTDLTLHLCQIQV